jgi:hypothetical protein
MMSKVLAFSSTVALVGEKAEMSRLRSGIAVRAIEGSPT